MYNFELERPKTLGEAVKMLSAEGAQALAGGQTLIPTLKQRLASPERLVSLAGIDEIKGVSASDGELRIGAGATHATVASEAKAYPALARLAGGIGDPAVRNRGTIGGSLANNDPSACYPAAALGSGATIVTSKRQISADDFFQGMFATALEEGEIIQEVRFPIPLKAGYQKFDQPASRFALVGVFAAYFPDGGIRVAVTGASENGVFRWTEAESAMSGGFTPGVSSGFDVGFSARRLSSLQMPPDGLIGDIHGSPEYRAHLVSVLARRAVESAE